MRNSHIRLFRNKKGVSPAISTIILFAAVISMILVVMEYGNNFLNSGLAENEFSGNKQFVQTTGLQIDDVAWTNGRTQTVSYTSKYGALNFTQSALSYTIEFNTPTNLTFQPIAQVGTGIILFNMPVRSYALGNNYFERLPASSNSSFMQVGSSVPVNQILCEEKMPMSDGGFSRLAVVPTIRVINSTITGMQNQTSTNYFKFYLPVLQSGTNLYRSQSVSLTGNGISKIAYDNANQVRINATFPLQAAGFDSSFFKFNQISQTINVATGASDTVVEFYMGNVLVSIGQV